MHPNKLAALLGKPGSGCPVYVHATMVSEGTPYSGYIKDGQGITVGIIDKFKYSFLTRDLPVQGKISPSSGSSDVAGRPVEAEFELTRKFIGPFDPAISYIGEWYNITDYLKGTDSASAGERAILKSDAQEIIVQLHCHGWSGIAQIYAGNSLITEIDLYNRETAIPRRVHISNPSQGNLTVEVRPTTRANSHSQGRQVIIECFYECRPPLRKPQFKKSRPVNRGSPFAREFLVALDNLPSDAAVLDIGGGRRQLDDPRYINLEYSPYDEPDIYGDALALPFKSNSIDLVYCAAVLEHVTDPQRAVDEMHRVLKPGGRVISAFAFMQPLHGEGQHFFNITNHGAEHLFRNFTTSKLWWDGSLQFTFSWMADLAGVRSKCNSLDWQNFQNLLSSFDNLVEYDRLRYVASAMWVDAYKPTSR